MQQSPIVKKVVVITILKQEIAPNDASSKWNQAERVLFISLKLMFKGNQTTVGHLEPLYKSTVSIYSLSPPRRSEWTVLWWAACCTRR